MIYSYVVEHDIGFAPNPFFGVCTLACCKPIIRNAANIGSWVVGIGSVKDGIRGKLVYAMKVEDRLTFNQYWDAVEFLCKRPTFDGSLKQAQGDNVYHKDSNGEWIAIPSRHTHSRPQMTEKHRERDTSKDSVLVSKSFVYFGQEAVDVPAYLRDKSGRSVYLDSDNTPNGGLPRVRDFDDEDLEAEFVSWLDAMGKWGYQGDPCEWRKKKILGFIEQNG